MTETTANVEISGEALRRYVEPIEELMGDRRELNRKITAVYRKAKEAGYQTPILRVIIAERALDAQVWADQQTLLQQYRQALGMFADTPLGEAAMASAEHRDARNGQKADKPTPFAAQPVHAPDHKRGRRKLVLFDQEHPQGTT
jgi:uncharacterized protein (UPF0335 family)